MLYLSSSHIFGTVSSRSAILLDYYFANEHKHKLKFKFNLPQIATDLLVNTWQPALVDIPPPVQIDWSKFVLSNHPCPDCYALRSKVNTTIWRGYNASYKHRLIGGNAWKGRSKILVASNHNDVVDPRFSLRFCVLRCCYYILNFAKQNTH